MGPSFENFRQIVELMQVHDSIRIVSGEMLPGVLVAMLHGLEEARALGERGRAVFEAQAGATARTVRALIDLLEERVVSG
jgi:3-deoxy-D-manno-octulosonic-acid transferase